MRKFSGTQSDNTLGYLALFRRYSSWINGKEARVPMWSHQLIKAKIIPLEKEAPTFFCGSITYVMINGKQFNLFDENFHAHNRGYSIA